MEGFLKKVNSAPRLSLVLKICCHVATALSILAFVYLGVGFFGRSPMAGAMYLVTLGVPFVLVSLLRKLINAPRPYELYDFYENPPKKKSGDSFPSRHAFSIFAIGTIAIFVNLPVAITLLFFGFLMCFCRVALGIHFVRDVLTGSLIGIISSVIGALIFI